MRVTLALMFLVVLMITVSGRAERIALAQPELVGAPEPTPAMPQAAVELQREIEESYELNKEINDMAQRLVGRLHLPPIEDSKKGD